MKNSCLKPSSYAGPTPLQHSLIAFSILACKLLKIQGETQVRVLQTRGFRRTNHRLARRRGLRQIRDSSLKEPSASTVSAVDGQSLPAATMRKSRGISS
eukprot:CAMPEP_0113618226 /NCGR_PEP_ID=MMETSP0017_2-20120614/9219_1 /TAXON_ID=2856 /ORGANISM="Cylindrotheca closterium" /LENGTH=98 /DNA_ID=CAMNT_0000527711 /DNA_START=121 /DNA_END=417 /DNA_ORIENTATION=+ /assembly_acc=CAM_ASM_000147